MKKHYKEATFSKDSFMFRTLLPIGTGITFLISFTSCSVSKQIDKVAKQNIITLILLLHISVFAFMIHQKTNGSTITREINILFLQVIQRS